MAQLVDARRSERRAARLGSSSLPLVTDDCRRGRCPTGSHKAGPPGSIPGPATTTYCGWASAQPGLISLDRRVQHPDPPLATGYANWQSDEAESLVILWVRRPPRSLEIPWSNGEDAWVTTRRAMVQLHPGSLLKKWSVGVLVAHLLGTEEDRVQLPDGPLELWAGMFRGGD